MAITRHIKSKSNHVIEKGFKFNFMETAFFVLFVIHGWGNFDQFIRSLTNNFNGLLTKFKLKQRLLAILLMPHQCSH